MASIAFLDIIRGSMATFFWLVLVANLPRRQKARGGEGESRDVAAGGEEEEAPSGILGERHNRGIGQA